MKNYSYIGISLIILIFGILFVPKIIDRVSGNQVVSSSRLDVEKEGTVDETPLAYIEINGDKKRVPDFQFVNQKGDTISNRDYEGKVYVAEFFFTTCPTICPIMNENLVAVQSEFESEENFGIASFSIDPEHDTPEVLYEYAKRYEISHENWHLMTGEKDAIYELANGGFNIYAGEDSNVPGGFAHSGFFALVDKEGYIRSRTDRFGNPIVYYRGSVEKGSMVGEGEEEPQIEILIEDIRKLL